jgi:hypothetical protein
MKTPTAEMQLEAFLDKYEPEIAALARAALMKMQARLPGAQRLVYDNYNALAIGFGPSERASEAIFSIAVYPRWVSLFFLHGAGLRDAAGVLRGSGKLARHVVLKSAEDLDRPEIRELMAAALEAEEKTLAGPAEGALIIKSISEKQRARRAIP